MKKKSLLLVCVVMVCTSLMGCGSTKEEQENVAAVEQVEASEGMQILPLPSTVDINNLDNCTVPVSFEQGDVYVDDTGAMQMDVTVYSYDMYDIVDMSGLKTGDVIVIRGQEVVVDSVEKSERGILINGGLDENGYEFSTDGTTVWFECGYDDAKYYNELGKVTVPVSADMNFYDLSDLDKGEVIYYAGDFLTNDAGIMYHFVPNNTCIVIENGMVIEMHRLYMP